MRVKEVEGFQRKHSHDLAKMLREMNKESQHALEVLISLLDSDNEDTRLKAVKLFLDHHRTVANDINADQITRLVATYKYKTPGSLVDEDDTPLINFDDIQDA